MLPLVLMVQEAPATIVEPLADDIVVLGQHMRKLRFKTKRDRKTGVMTCRIQRSGGDAELDGLACEAGIACSGATEKAEMVACLAPRVTAGWNALLAARNMQNTEKR